MIQVRPSRRNCRLITDTWESILYLKRIKMVLDGTWKGGRSTSGTV